MNLHDLLEEENRKAIEQGPQPARPAEPEKPILYRHKYLPGVTAEQVATCKNGAVRLRKTYETPNRKSRKTALEYYRPEEMGVWERIQ